MSFFLCSPPTIVVRLDTWHGSYVRERASSSSCVRVSQSVCVSCLSDVLCRFACRTVVAYDIRNISRFKVAKRVFLISQQHNTSHEPPSSPPHAIGNNNNIRVCTAWDSTIMYYCTVSGGLDKRLDSRP